MRVGLVRLVTALSIFAYGMSGYCSEKNALIKVPFTGLRREPRHASEMLTQATMGTPVAILADSTSDWLTVRLPDGYEGFINRSAIIEKSESEMAQWKESRRATTSGYYPQPMLTPDSCLICFLEPGSVVELADNAHFRLPDGREGFCDNVAWLSRNFKIPTAEDIIDAAFALIGTPYLWGGNTSSALDCSGLVRYCFLQYDIITPRDASQLYNAGRKRRAEENIQRGDLIFFSTRKDGPITHVGIYAGDGKYIHCSGEVKISSMTDNDADFSKRIYRGAVDWSGIEGFMPLATHPWYFSLEE